MASLKPEKFSLTEKQTKFLLVSLSFSLPLLLLGKIYFRGAVCKIKKDLREKVALITGGTEGVSLETACALASMGARVVITSRKTKGATEALNKIAKRAKNKEKAEFYHVQLEKFEEVRKFVKEFSEKHEKLDILVLGESVAMLSKREVSPSGQELHFAVNHLGHFLLSYSLLAKMRENQAKVVVVSSLATAKIGQIYFKNSSLNRGAYSPLSAFAQSKLANIMFCRQLQKEADSKGLSLRVTSADPGYVRRFFRERGSYGTLKGLVLGILKSIVWVPIAYFTKSAKQGAQTILYCALEDNERLVPGGVYSECKEAEAPKKALDENACSKLWILSEEETKLIKSTEL